jgi:glycosyltransferase involved in cell wall biosynthesis
MPSISLLAVLSRPVGGRDATEAARGSIEELGCRTVLTDDASFDPSEASAVLVWGNAGLFPRAFERLAALPAGRRPVVAVWHSEVLPFARASGVRRPRLTARELAKAVLRHPRAIDPYTNARRLVRLVRRGLLDLVVVISEDRREFLAERGVEAEVVPRGYHPSFGSDLGAERDVDVLFLGALDVPRRRRILRGLERAGVDVLARGDWRDPRYWGAPRAALLNRAKISLNLSRHSGQFSGDRFTLSMGNGALVVSEPAHRPAPFRPGEHYLEAPVSDLAATISRILADEEERQRIATAGREFVTRELTMTRAAARVLALIEERSGGRLS